MCVPRKHVKPEDPPLPAVVVIEICHIDEVSYRRHPEQIPAPIDFWEGNDKLPSTDALEAPWCMDDDDTRG